MSDKRVLIDVATAGASGDMFLSSLVDLIGNDEAIVPVAASLLLYDPTIRVKIVPETSNETAGKRLEVTSDKGTRFTPASLKEIITSTSQELELSKKATSFAAKALDELLQAEVRAHDTPLKDLHLHETGSIDTALDIVGTAYLLEKAGLIGSKFLSTKVAVGNGKIQTEHGELEVPVPAVAEIIVHNDIPFHNGDAPTEVLTPTGAAILAALVEDFVESSEGFKIEKQGFGFGTRDLGDVVNAMNISEGVFESPEPAKKKPKKQKSDEPAKAAPSKKKIVKVPVKMDDWETDEVIVIEANVDDIDGEVLGELFAILLGENLAYDVVMIPAFGKKNRPCYVVKVVAAKAGLSGIADLMIKHLGTLGIRYTTWNRLKAAREVIVCRLEVDDEEFMVRVKISRGRDGSIVNIKPEADDVIKVSRATGISIRELKPRIVLQAHAITD